MLAFDPTPWRRLRLASWLEGGSLILLLCVAVPLKHLGGQRLAVTVMGPIHGLAFLSYLWLLISLSASGDLRRSETLRLALAAMIPFGALWSRRWIGAKLAAQAHSANEAVRCSI